MNTVRINISIPQEILTDLSREIEPRNRSRFITEAIERYLADRRAQRLAAEYQEAAAEIKRVNQELEGVVSDGLD